MTRLPTPTPNRPEILAWVARHLDGLFQGPLSASPSFVGGQTAASAALSDFSVAGYAARRNEVWPEARRGASRLSPYIRHGLLQLPSVWDAVADGPSRDVQKFRDELLWQEYARHVYARLGRASRQDLRARLPARPWDDPWPDEMACVRLAVQELEEHGWLVNQTRMWLASQWSVREQADWRRGEDLFFAHLLDGSRAANRLGWQWTAGTATGRPYGFSRWQVNKRAPGLCAHCSMENECPIEDWPPDPPLTKTEPPPLLRHDPDPGRSGGPVQVERRDEPEAVWLTAESLGDADPALAFHQELPAVFVFDHLLLSKLNLSAKRLVFLVETVADLGTRRPVEIYVGNPTEILATRPVAATFTPVPGWHTRAERIQPVEVHPWPWLRYPHSGSATSFSAWRKRLKSEG